MLVSIDLNGNLINDMIEAPERFSFDVIDSIINIVVDDHKSTVGSLNSFQWKLLQSFPYRINWKIDNNKLFLTFKIYGKNIK